MSKLLVEDINDGSSCSNDDSESEVELEKVQEPEQQKYQKEPPQLYLIPISPQRIAHTSKNKLVEDLNDCSCSEDDDSSIDSCPLQDINKTPIQTQDPGQTKIKRISEEEIKNLEKNKKQRGETLNSNTFVISTLSRANGDIFNLDTNQTVYGMEYKAPDSIHNSNYRERTNFQQLKEGNKPAAKLKESYGSFPSVSQSSNSKDQVGYSNMVNDNNRSQLGEKKIIQNRQMKLFKTIDIIDDHDRYETQQKKITEMQENTEQTQIKLGNKAIDFNKNLINQLKNRLKLPESDHVSAYKQKKAEMAKVLIEDEGISESSSQSSLSDLQEDLLDATSQNKYQQLITPMILKRSPTKQAYTKQFGFLVNNLKMKSRNQNLDKKHLQEDRQQKLTNEMQETVKLKVDGIKEGPNLEEVLNEDDLSLSEKN